MAQPLPISIVIHVKNEEINLPHALRSIEGRFGQVFVVDAASTDRTKEVCNGFNVTFVQIEGDRSTLVKQRNWALENLPFTNDWAYILDADERFTDDLYDEICALFANGGPPDDADAYMVRYKEIILGRWVKHAAFYPNWGIRLIRHKVVRHELRSVNSSLKSTSERTRRLQSHFIHDDKRGYIAYIRRLGGVSALEAKSLSEIYADDESQVKGRLLSANPLERRRALKKLFYSLPGRPLIVFCYLYFFRGGILEGRPGFYTAYMRMTHEVFLGALRYDTNKKEYEYDGR